MKDRGAPVTVAEYIGQQDRKTQAILKKLRATILKTAPGAEERISYRMPAYFMKGVIVYFAAWEKHVGLYPGAGAIVEFEKELETYVHAKGSIQFPLERPFPYGLVQKIVRYRLATLAGKDKSKAAWKTRSQVTATRLKRKNTPRRSKGVRIA